MQNIVSSLFHDYASVCYSSSHLFEAFATISGLIPHPL